MNNDISKRLFDHLPIANAAWWLTLIAIFSIGFMKPLIFVSNQRLSPVDLLFPLTALLVLASMIVGQISVKFDRSYLYFGAYFGAMLISSIFSLDPTLSFKKLLGEAYLIGLAVLVIVQTTTDSRFRQVSLAWLAGAGVTVFVAFISVILYYFAPGNRLLQYTLYSYGSVPVINFPRISSTMVSASMFCNYLTVGIAIAFVANTKGWIGKWVFRVAVILMILAAISTISIGIGGVFLVLGICIYTTSSIPRARFRRYSMFAAVIIAVVFYLSSFVALKPHSTSPYSFDLPIIGNVQPSPRTLVWTAVLQTIAADLIVGKGLDQPVCAVRFENTDGSYSMLTDAHNIYLSVAGQNGFVGLAALLALIAFLWRIGYRSDDVAVRLLWAAFVSAFIYQGFIGAYEDARHLWVLMGLLVAVSKLGSSTQESLAHCSGV